MSDTEPTKAELCMTVAMVGIGLITAISACLWWKETVKKPQKKESDLCL